MKILFVPTYYDGLSRSSGSARIRAEWVCRYWDGAEVMDGGQRLAGYDLYVFQKAYLVEQARDWIHTVARWRDEGRCRLAFDLCDPDFLDHEHERRMLGVLPLFDFAVATTRPLANWLAWMLPTYVIPDRVDVAECEGVGMWEWGGMGVGKWGWRKGGIWGWRGRDAPRLVWAGYDRNVGALDTLTPVIEELGLEIEVLAVDRPRPFEDFWREVLGYDILLNPRPDVPPFIYKSDNKTLIAWAMGMPVARTAEELRRLCDPGERVRESELRRAEVREKWDVRLSVRRWQEIFTRWGVR